MQHSEKNSELFSALSKALGEIESIPLNKTNPHFKSKYADLAITIEKSKPALSKYGLMLIQSVENEGDKYLVESMITHSSGEWLKSRVELILTKKDMQGLGSATTYAKRYAAQSLLFVAGDEDDDGNAASSADANKDPKPKDKEPPKPPPGPTPAMLKRLYAIGNSMGWKADAVRIFCMAKVNRTPGKLSKAQYDQLCELIEGSPFDEMQASEIDSMYEKLNDQQKEEIKGD